MSGTRHGISTSAITWEPTESEVVWNKTGGVAISVVGSVGVNGTSTSLDDAIQLLPSTIPISASGPIGNSTRYTGAVLVAPSARYMGDDTIQVSATYEIAVPESPSEPEGGEGTNSDSDRARRQIVTEEAPILSHPIVQEFGVNERRALAALISGEVRPNPAYDENGSGKELHEFIRDVENGSTIEEVEFDDQDQTLDGVSASPLDYARMIAAGITTWKRPVIRHILTKNRNEPATNGEYGQVGEALQGSPQLAPSIDGDFQWFVNGITDETSNGLAWQTTYEYELSGAGGVLKHFYKNGDAEIA